MRDNLYETWSNPPDWPETWEEESAIYDYILETESMATMLMDVGSPDDYDVQPTIPLLFDGR